MIKLSPHFTLDELCDSQVARKFGISNEPGYIERANLAYLAVHVLEPAREKLGLPIIVTSGYRCPQLNARVGGVPNSYHLRGCAADLQCADMKRLFKILAANPYVDMVLFEHSNSAHWLHVQVARSPRRTSNFNYRV